MQDVLSSKEFLIHSPSSIDHFVVSDLWIRLAHTSWPKERAESTSGLLDDSGGFIYNRHNDPSSCFPCFWHLGQIHFCLFFLDGKFILIHIFPPAE